MCTPFFSIIIPVYNAGRYLGECLRSILVQDFADWEVVIADDGSTDNSVEVAERFMRSDPRIRLVRMPSNSGGAYLPRMEAAKMAAADWLVVIDADDVVSPDLLGSHRDILTSTGADLVIPEMWRIKGGASQKILPVESFDCGVIWKGADLVAHTLCLWSIPMAGFAVRRSIYLDSDLELSDSDRKSIFADELLTRWILLHCGGVAFSKARYYYRYNEVSVTHTNVPRFIFGKMLTCDSLIAMTEASFGAASPTHLRALENKFLSAVDCLRLISSSRLDAGERRSAQLSVANAMKGFDLSLLKGRVSPRYLALMRLPLPLARRVLCVIDRLLKKK